MSIYHELNDENFSRTYEAHAAHIKGVLANRGCPATHLDDVSQEVAMRLWSKRGQYSPEKGTLKAWIAVVAQNSWYNFRKSLTSEPEMVQLSQLVDRGDAPMEEGDIYPAAPSPEAVMNLQLDLNKLLKPAEQELLRFFLEGLTRKEIAERIGTSPTAVRGRLSRMRDKLRAAGVYSSDVAICSEDTETMNNNQRQRILECLTRFSDFLTQSGDALEAQVAAKQDTAGQ
jgi:RNA polymerase sigma-70 factor, ECF subfamily